MKFRYKVLLTNLILLSISLGMVGYLMIRKNFELAKDAQIKNAIVENNLVQASVEYEVLQVINSGQDVNGTLADIGKQVASGMLISNASFYIKSGDAYVYSSDGGEKSIREELFLGLSAGGKNYLIGQENDSYVIYVTSYSSVQGEDLCVISKRDISDMYQMLKEQVRYFRILIAAILILASVIMYRISVLLTRPLEKLNQITDEITAGNYDAHVEVRTDDEVGQLADKFNHMARAVAEHVAELNDMIHRREQFVADFIHEIKTPMTAIIGYADTMRSMEIPKEEEFKALNYIFSEGRRLERMSGKLFDLLYLGQHEIEKKACHTTDLAQELERTVTPMLEKSGIALHLELEPAVVEIDRELMLTVFVNLIDNARKASGEGDIVEVCGSIWKETYEFTVTDHGIGMSEEDCRRICDEFYMVDKSRSREEGGAGLGMSLVALILECHGAKLSISSKLGEGTRMSITL